MNKSDLCIYGYLLILGICCIIYGSIVVTQSGTHGPALNVNVVLPLDSVSQQDVVRDQLMSLSNVTQGVTVSVWWGPVEQTQRFYNWTDYINLFNMIQATLPAPKIKVILSFHACYNNEYCATNISLPSWVKTIAGSNPSIFYTDINGATTYEYLTSGIDHQPVLGDRSAIDVYADFIQAFATQFNDLFDTVITEVQIGLGPAGELRYPAFPNGQWTMPGIGQFQCYDSYLANEYITFATKSGHKEWAYLPSAESLSYNDTPKEALFFNSSLNPGNNSRSDYGQFFMSWYSNRLLQHGSAILSQASSILQTYSPNITLGAKLGCIYWQSGDPSHAAEYTAGYFNYTTIASVLGQFDVTVEFGCYDLSNGGVEKALGHTSNPNPEGLVNTVFLASQAAGLKLQGTNSNVDSTSEFDRIETNCRHDISTVVGFDYRYLSEELITNLRDFRDFYDAMTHPAKLK